MAKAVKRSVGRLIDTYVSKVNAAPDNTRPSSKNSSGSTRKDKKAARAAAG